MARQIILLSLIFTFNTVWALNDGAGVEFFSTNVGIQDNSPVNTLQVNGQIMIENGTTACVSTTEGSQRYNRLPAKVKSKSLV